MSDNKVNYVTQENARLVSSYCQQQLEQCTATLKQVLQNINTRYPGMWSLDRDKDHPQYLQLSRGGYPAFKTIIFPDDIDPNEIASMEKGFVDD